MNVHIDPITCEPIPEQDRVFVEGSCFNIQTLYSYYTVSGKLQNPYTTNPLPEDVKERVLALVQSKEICITYKKKENKYAPSAIVGEVLKRLLYYDDFYAGEDLQYDGKSLFDAEFTAKLETLEKNQIEVTLSGYVGDKRLDNFIHYLGQSDEGLNGALAERLEEIRFSSAETEVIEELELTVDRSCISAREFYCSVLEDDSIEPEEVLDLVCVMRDYGVLIRVLWYGEGLRCSFASAVILLCTPLKNDRLIRIRNRLLNGARY